MVSRQGTAGGICLRESDSRLVPPEYRARDQMRYDRCFDISKVMSLIVWLNEQDRLLDFRLTGATQYHTSWSFVSDYYKLDQVDCQKLVVPNVGAVLKVQFPEGDSPFEVCWPRSVESAEDFTV